MESRPNQMNEDMKRVALVVEDDPASKQYISLLLKKLEYEFIATETGEQALEIMKNEQVDIMLLDIALGPGMSGIELGTQLKAQSRHENTPMIAVSAFSKEEVDELQPAGFIDYLTKPYTIKELESILAKYLS